MEIVGLCGSIFAVALISTNLQSCRLSWAEMGMIDMGIAGTERIAAHHWVKCGLSPYAVQRTC